MQCFTDRLDAEAALAALRGWPEAKVVELDDGDGGSYWGIECAPGRFMGSDGFVI